MPWQCPFKKLCFFAPIMPKIMLAQSAKACFKVHNFVVIQQDTTKLGQMTNLKVFFHMMVSIYKLDKICNTTQSPTQPQSGSFLLFGVTLSRDISFAKSATSFPRSSTFLRDEVTKTFVNLISFAYFSIQLA